MTVMGPYDAATWLTMGMLKRDIDYMVSKSAEKFKLPIKAQQESLKILKSA